MADDTTIIEGTVKFRDGKKWKSRWCVMRKLSPVADCVHLQLYRDARARRAAAGGAGGAACKAALSLQQFVGSEAGFTLDKHSNTLALVCRDLVAVLAFDTRERLIQWQVKVNSHLGESRQYVVVVCAAPAGGAAGGTRRVPAGPARLHLRERRCALTAGAPPRLHGVWELHHLRRFGVVEGRFCFEGGSACARGEGLHVLVSDQTHELARDFELAARGRLSPRHRPAPPAHPPHPPGAGGGDGAAEEAAWLGERGASPADWEAAGPGAGDTASVRGVEGADGAWAGAALERCMSCMSKLGALSRSSTAALTPGAKHFSPAWTMEAVREAPPAADARSEGDDDGADACRCPPRPPKPALLHLTLDRRPAPPPAPPPVPQSCDCAQHNTKSTRIGPYENYDVPRVPSTEVEGEYYDTPKRLKECFDDELFRVTKNSTPDTLVLKKPCGCLLKFGKRRTEPTIVDTEENLQPTSCPCQRVTDWANNWIKLPYCRRNTVSSDISAPNKENVVPADRDALYATIDVSRKARRRAADAAAALGRARSAVEIDEGPLANYENLDFALSLEHYENARDLLRRAGVTQTELDAIGANLRPASFVGACAQCGRPPRAPAPAADYLVMQPAAAETGRGERSARPPAGYTPMSPVGGFAVRTLEHPARSPAGRLLEEKSASNPALCAPRPPAACACRSPPARRPRSSSADSSRFLDDLREAEGAGGERGSASSVETLRDAAGARCGGDKLSDGDSSGGCAGAAPPANRDSSSSNDSGVSSCSLRVGEERGGGAGGPHFELPLTTHATRRHYPRGAPPAPRPRGPRRAPPAPRRAARARRARCRRSPPPPTPPTRTSPPPLRPRCRFFRLNHSKAAGARGTRTARRAARRTCRITSRRCRCARRTPPPTRRSPCGWCGPRRARCARAPARSTWRWRWRRFPARARRPRRRPARTAPRFAPTWHRLASHAPHNT